MLLKKCTTGVTIGLALSFISTETNAASCPTSPFKIKKALTCINERLDALEGIDRSTEPVYQDNLIRVSAKASRSRTDNPTEYTGNIVLRIKNITSQSILLKQNVGRPVTVTDDSAVSCTTRLDGFPFSGQNDVPSTYLTLKAGKTAVATVLPNFCAQKFEGTQFDLSIDMLVYEETTNNAASFTVGLTGIPAPIK